MNAEAIKVLEERRSVRRFSDRQVPRELADKMFKTAIMAPTGKGLQNPLIVAVDDAETRAQLSRMNAEVLGAKIDPYFGAPLIAIVFSPNDGSTFVEDASAVLTYITLAAKSYGLASCWINRERQMFVSDEGRALMKKWGVAEKYIGIGAIAIGYQDGSDPAPAPRKTDYVRWD
jgi:nitroreductase